MVARFDELINPILVRILFIELSDYPRRDDVISLIIHCSVISPYFAKLFVCEIYATFESDRECCMDGFTEGECGVFLSPCSEQAFRGVEEATETPGCGAK